MFNKISEAIHLFRTHFKLIASLVLTVWLPANLLIEYYDDNFLYQENIFKIMGAAMWIEALLGPIYIGAIIFLLSEAKQGQNVKYKEAIVEGLRNWGALFKARFFAGLLIVLGLIALIIPGIYLALRFSLIEYVVVLEGADTRDSRERSTELTEGIRWELLGAALISNIGVLILSFVGGFIIGLLQVSFPALDTFFISAIVDSATNVLFSIITIIFFLYYWEVTTNEPREATPVNS